MYSPGGRAEGAQLTPKCWWSHWPSLPRTETRCLRCEGNWICALTFSPTCVQISHLKASGRLLFDWSTRSSASSSAALPQSAVIPPALHSVFSATWTCTSVYKKKSAALLISKSCQFETGSTSSCMPERREFFTTTSGGGDCCCQSRGLPFPDRFLFLSTENAQDHPSNPTGLDQRNTLQRCLNSGSHFCMWNV